MRMVLSLEGEAMNRPQGDQAMRSMVPVYPRQMHRSLSPGTGSSPTRTPSASSTTGGFAVDRKLLALIFIAIAWVRYETRRTLSLVLIDLSQRNRPLF